MFIKNNVYGLCTALVLFTTSFSANALEVTSFNIRYDNPSDGINWWFWRRGDVIKLIKQSNADAIGMQEVLDSQLNYLNNGLDGYASFGVARDDGLRSGEYSPIFYKKDALALQQQGTFWLSPTPSKPSKGWDAALPRICTWGLFKNKASDELVYIYNTHFDHQGQLARAESAKVIMDKINNRKYPEAKVVLLGDFNLTINAAPMQYIASQLDDTFNHSLSGHVGPVGTFNNFNPYQTPQYRIDHVFSKGYKVSSHKHDDQRRIFRLWYSDHLPVTVTLD